MVKQNQILRRVARLQALLLPAHHSCNKEMQATIASTILINRQKKLTIAQNKNTTHEGNDSTHSDLNCSVSIESDTEKYLL